VADADPRDAAAQAPPASARRAQSASHGVVFLTAAGAVQVVAGYGVHVLGTRLLGAADYGRFAVVMSVTTGMRNLLTTVMVEGLQKCVSEDHRRLRQALAVSAKWYSLLMGLVTMAFVAAMPFLPAAFNDAALLPVFIVAAVEIPFVGLFTLGTRLQTALRQYGQAAGLMSVYSVVKVAALCAFVLAGWGAAGAIGGQSAASVVTAILAAVMLAREVRALPVVHYAPLLRRTWQWTATGLPAGLGMTTLLTVDMWLVKAMIDDPDAAGLYGAAYSLSRLPMFLVQGLVGAVFPRVSEALAQGRPELARSVSAESMRVLFVVFFGVCGVVAGADRQITTLLFSARYAEAGTPLTLLTIAASLYAWLFLQTRLIAACDRHAVRMALVMALLPVSVGLTAALIPRWGLEGAALASLVTFAGGVAAGVALVWRHLRALPPGWPLLRCALAGTAVYGAGVLWPAAGWLLVAKLGAVTALYFVLLLALRELRGADLRILGRVFRR